MWQVVRTQRVGQYVNILKWKKTVLSGKPRLSLKPWTFPGFKVVGLIYIYNY